MDNILEYLEKLDLSEIEAKLYLKLLKTGQLSVRELASITGIKRTTAYIYIDQLIEKGLLIKLVKGSHKLVAANKPEDCLQDLVEKKIQTAKSVQNEFPNMLETITMSIPQVQDISESEIRYYKGKDGVRKIYEEALKAKELRTYVSLSDMQNFFPENMITFAKAIKNNPDLMIFEVAEDSPGARRETQTLSQNKRYHFKFLPRDVKITSSDILIYDGKVSIINVRGKVSGVILNNVDYYNLSRELFNLVWRILPEIDQEG